MASVKIVVANAEERRNIELVAAYGQVQDRLSIVEGPALSLQSSPSGQDTLTGHNTILRYIADLSVRRHELLGSDDTSRAQIMEWLSFRNIGLSPITEEKLELVSEHLLTRMYLVDKLSLADLCLFAKLHQALSHLPPAQTGRYCNLVRWFDDIQHTALIDGIYKLVEFTKPSLPEAPQLPQKIVQPTQAGKDAPANEGSNKGKVNATKTADDIVADTNKSSKSPATTSVEDTPSSSTAGSTLLPPPESLKDFKQAKKESRKEARREAEPKKSEEARIDMLDLRVGQIVDVQPHPNADALYVEDIDVGEDKPRQVVSGLRNFVGIEQMKGRRVVVCTNLKPAKMRDVMSYGMVLCASNKAHDKVDPLVPPAAAKIGERVTFSGFDEQPLPEINPKKKILEKVKEDLQTDSVGVATYKTIPFMCSGEPVISKIPLGHVG